MQTATQKESSQDDGGRHRSDAATAKLHQGLPSTLQELEEAREDFNLELSEGA